MFRHTTLFIFLFLVMRGISYGQTPEEKDSSKVYRDIETYSKKGKFTKFIYGLFFKPVKVKTPVSGKKSVKTTPQTYRAYEGKVIRNIHITTLDPFGYSVEDTSRKELNFIYRAGNKAHIKSLGLTIRNLLLFRRNDTFDSLLVRESERLIRAHKYVHDVAFTVKSAGRGSDSVDIYIRERDIWSILPGIGISPSVFKIRITEKNFLGLGHELEAAGEWFFNPAANAMIADYGIPNIKNTYVNSRLHYSFDEYGNFERSINVERPFFSPFARWAGGVFLGQQLIRDSIHYRDSVYVPFITKFNTNDYWVGGATRIFKGNTEDERTTNLILAVRYVQIRYHEKPAVQYDTTRIFSDENFYLGAIGISTRKYVQDRYIFNYGLIEDVPVGNVYALTGGYKEKNNSGRLYLGLRYSIGNYYKPGYISANF